MSALAERATKTEAIVKLLSDGKPRTVAELSDELGLRNLDSLLSNMWRRGHVLASKKVSIYKPMKEDCSWRWSRGKQRWYIVASESQVVKRVACHTETLKEALFSFLSLWCGGGDLNPRTPKRRDLESRAVDLAWQPPQSEI